MVYVESRRSLWGALVIGVPVTLGALLFSVYLLTDSSPRDVNGALVSLGAAAVFGGLFVVMPFRALRHQNPYFLVDERGIECARGRFTWQDILDINETTEWKDGGRRRTLTFSLHEATRPQPVERTYVDGMVGLVVARPLLTEHCLEIAVGSCARRARSALASYDHAPWRS